MIGARHESDVMFKRTVDSFAELYAESEQSARVLCIAVHPYISGVPHRIRYFRELLQHLKEHEGLVFWNGDQIYRWFTSQRPEPDYVP